ncbi:hypothetical protein GIB67_037432 [Kingdonia uniflora]|uniref:Homeobox-leucine zipper protein n=1 Tax=Kingdonia uniflora TaxID=39325 RepID=A0A7J7LY47_9MAGN|nr:hypothetical protein GIB67_037432 [Kingdonia uniflora]
MDFFQSHSQKQTFKPHKKRLTQEQLRLLENNFDHDKKLEPERKLQLAQELGLAPRQVAIWYQNKRARWKNQNLELDYQTLQLRLESTLMDKRRLEREVGRLRQELQMAQDVIMGLNQNGPPVCSLSLSTSGEEDGNSNYNSSFPSGDVNCSWGNSDTLKVEELYACLMSEEDHPADLNSNIRFSLSNLPRQG